MARTVNSLGDRHVKANKQEEEIKTTIVVPMTINVIQANVDDWTIFFVGLEVSRDRVSTYIKKCCCLSFVIKASLNFSLWRQIHFHSLQ